MRIPSHHFDSAGRSDATMTPMIDVVFLLLIFFVCTASFQIVEQDLPSSLRIESGAGISEVIVESELLDLQSVVVKIFWQDGAPQWQVNGMTHASLADVRAILAAVAAVDTNIPVILDVAGEVPLGHVIAAYDVSRLVGFAKIQFAASVDA